MDARSKKLQYWSLNIASFLGQCAISMVNLALVYYLRYTLNAPARMIAFAASIYTSVYLIACLSLSKIYQHFAPRKMVALSMVMMAIPVVLITKTQSIGLIAFYLVLYGLAMSMLWPQMEAWITRGSEGKELNKLTSSFNFSWSFGTGLSPYIASLLVTKTPAYGLLGGAIIFIAIFILINLISLNRDIRAIKPESEVIAHTDISEDHSTPLRYDSYIAVFLVYSALSVVLNIFPIYTKEVLAIGESTNGFLLLLRGIATCFAFIYFGKTSWWQFKFKYILGAEILFVFIITIFAKQTSVISLAIFMILFGLIFSLCYNFSIFHAASGAIDKGKRMMIHECVLTVGQVIGVSIAGGIYDKLGWTNVLFVIASIGVVFVICQFGVNLLRKKKSTLK